MSDPRQKAFEEFAGQIQGSYGMRDSFMAGWDARAAHEPGAG